MRAGLVLMLEWGSLTVIETAPPYLKWATVIIAILGLAVHESWPWLNMRDRRWYPALMGGLVLAFIGICGFAVLTDPPGPSISMPAPSPAPAVPVPEMPKQPLNADEVQFRTDLRKFILNPLGQIYADSTRLAYLTMQNQGHNNAPANLLLTRVMQESVAPKIDPFILSLRDLNIENMDTAKIQTSAKDSLAIYNELQGYILAYQKLTNVQFDPALLSQWISDDSSAVLAFGNLKTYPEATIIRQIQTGWFISASHSFDALLKNQ
jgi:hypothetical protein